MPTLAIRCPPMFLRKIWRIVLCFAIAGFLIPEFAVLSFTLRVSDLLTNIMTLLSPGLWLLGHAHWSTAYRGWLIFALGPMANAVLYAVFGFVIVSLIARRGN
jgi:hypothetical protein